MSRTEDEQARRTNFIQRSIEAANVNPRNKIRYAGDVRTIESLNDFAEWLDGTIEIQEQLRDRHQQLGVFTELRIDIANKVADIWSTASKLGISRAESEAGNRSGASCADLIDLCSRLLIRVKNQLEKQDVNKEGSAHPANSPAVVLQGEGKPAIVHGKTKEISAPQYRVIKSLIDGRGKGGITKDTLETKGGSDARGILDRLRAKDPDWERAIHMAGNTGGRYRID